jgi:hypothetical protein
LRINTPFNLRHYRQINGILGCSKIIILTQISVLDLKIVGLNTCFL